MVGAKMEIRYSLNRIAVLLFFFCMNFSSAIGFSQLGMDSTSKQIQLGLIGVSVACLMVNYINFKKVKITSILLIVILLIIAILSFNFTSNLAVFRMVLFLIIAQGLSVQKILSYNNYTLLFSFCIIILSSFIGITDMNYYGDIHKLYSFGFQNPNTPPVIVFTLITGYNLLKNKKLKKKEIFVEMGISLFIYYFFQNRTALIVLSFYLMFLIIANCASKSICFKWVMKPFQYLFFIGTVLTCYVAFYFNPIDPTWYDWNILLSGRLALWKNFLYTYGMSIFGASSTNVIEPLDNAYLYLLIFNGILVLIFFNGIFLYLSRFAYKCKNWGLFLAVIAYELYFFSESAPLSFNLCSVLLVFSCLVMNTKESRQL